MLHSMTGYGHSSGSACGYRIRVDIRSLNHRYLEVSVRLPRNWMELEDRVRKQVSQAIMRGRVEVHITAERETGSNGKVEIDWTMADGYYQAAEQLRERYGFQEGIRLNELIALPGVIIFQEENDEVTDELAEALATLIDEALEQLIQMCRREGAHLFEHIASRLDKLEHLHEQLSQQASGAAKKIAMRHRERIADLLQDLSQFDEQRFQMEVAIMADRADVDEEITRLASHFRQFRQIMAQERTVGRKLDFLIQEMNREINTIGSKAAQTELVELVVEMKSELEKIREQIQNIQ